MDVSCEYATESSKPTGDLNVSITNRDPVRSCSLRITDHAYKSGDRSVMVKAAGKTTVTLRLTKSFSWYDFSVRSQGNSAFERRCAGRVETGLAGYSDPAMA